MLHKALLCLSLSVLRRSMRADAVAKSTDAAIIRAVSLARSAYCFVNVKARIEMCKVGLLEMLRHLPPPPGVSICTFVLVKQVLLYS